MSALPKINDLDKINGLTQNNSPQNTLKQHNKILDHDTPTI